MMTWTTSEDYAVLKLRIPVELKDWLRNRAMVSMRPLNSEVVLALLEHREREEPSKTKPATK